MRNLDDVAFRGTGLALSRTIELVAQIWSCQATGGSSYIKTPEHIGSKKAVVNAKNHDVSCFKWAILSALRPAATVPQELHHNYP